MSRRQLVDAVEHRVRRGDVAERGEERRRGRGDAAGLVGKGEQGLDLGGEAQLVAGSGPEQRLLPGAVARQYEALTGVVPDRQPEHPLELGDAVGAVPRVQGDDGLDVARRPERIAGALAALAQLRGVVDLAVADHPDGAVGTLERLIPGRQVHDGEPASAEARALVSHDALAVGSAVRERGGHRGDRSGVTERQPRERHDAEDAAHVSVPRHDTARPIRRVAPVLVHEREAGHRGAPVAVVGAEHEHGGLGARVP